MLPRTLKIGLQSPFLLAQRSMMRIWSKSGLKRICPLIFEDIEGIVPPYTRGNVKQVGQTRFSGGTVIRLNCTLNIRIPDGAPYRQKIENGLCIANRIARVTAQELGPVSECIPANADINQDAMRQNGRNVTLIPWAFEIWITVTTTW